MTYYVTYFLSYKNNTNFLYKNDFGFIYIEREKIKNKDDIDDLCKEILYHKEIDNDNVENIFPISWKKIKYN